MQVFDLKGSLRNRNVKTDTGKESCDVVLLDENLLKMVRDNPLYIRSHCKAVLRASIHSDSQFLSSHLIIDYSLLVGRDDTNNELVVGIIGRLSFVFSCFQLVKLSSGFDVYSTHRTVLPSEMCVKKACLFPDGIPPSPLMGIQNEGRKPSLKVLYRLVLAFSLLRMYAGGDLYAQVVKKQSSWCLTCTLTLLEVRKVICVFLCLILQVNLRNVYIAI